MVNIKRNKLDSLEADDAFIRLALQNGDTIKKIAHDLSMPYHRVRSYIRRRIFAGSEVPKRVRIDREALRRLFLAGFSQQDMADFFGVSQSRISQLCAQVFESYEYGRHKAAMLERQVSRS